MMPEAPADSYQLIVDRPADPRSRLVATAPAMASLLELNQQLTALGYRMVKLERIAQPLAVVT